MHSWLFIEYLSRICWVFDSKWLSYIDSLVCEICICCLKESQIGAASNEPAKHEIINRCYSHKVPTLINNDKQVKHALARLKSGPRLNIKTVLSTYGDFHVKDKTAVRTSYL